jgi:hypothetical protein
MVLSPVYQLFHGEHLPWKGLSVGTIGLGILGFLACLILDHLLGSVQSLPAGVKPLPSPKGEDVPRYFKPKLNRL